MVLKPPRRPAHRWFRRQGESRRGALMGGRRTDGRSVRRSVGRIGGRAVDRSGWLDRSEGWAGGLDTACRSDPWCCRGERLSSRATDRTPDRLTADRRTRPIAPPTGRPPRPTDHPDRPTSRPTRPTDGPTARPTDCPTARPTDRATRPTRPTRPASPTNPPDRPSVAPGQGHGDGRRLVWQVRADGEVARRVLDADLRTPRGPRSSGC